MFNLQSFIPVAKAQIEVSDVTAGVDAMIDNVGSTLSAGLTTIMPFIGILAGLAIVIYLIKRFGVRTKP